MMVCDFYSPPCGGGAGGEAVERPLGAFWRLKHILSGAKRYIKQGMKGHHP